MVFGQVAERIRNNDDGNGDHDDKDRDVHVVDFDDEDDANEDDGYLLTCINHKSFRPS